MSFQYICYSSFQLNWSYFPFPQAPNAQSSAKEKQERPITSKLPWRFFSFAVLLCIPKSEALLYLFSFPGTNWRSTLELIGKAFCSNLTFPLTASSLTSSHLFLCARSLYLSLANSEPALSFSLWCGVCIYRFPSFPPLSSVMPCGISTDSRPLKKLTAHLRVQVRYSPTVSNWLNQQRWGQDTRDPVMSPLKQFAAAAAAHGMHVQIVSIHLSCFSIPSSGQVKHDHVHARAQIFMIRWTRMSPSVVICCLFWNIFNML